MIVMRCLYETCIGMGMCIFNIGSSQAPYTSTESEMMVTQGQSQVVNFFRCRASPIIETF